MHGEGDKRCQGLQGELTEVGDEIAAPLAGGGSLGRQRDRPGRHGHLGLQLERGLLGANEAHMPAGRACHSRSHTQAQRPSGDRGADLVEQAGKLGGRLVWWRCVERLELFEQIRQPTFTGLAQQFVDAAPGTRAAQLD